jgi:hypothetical protein
MQNDCYVWEDLLFFVGSFFWNIQSGQTWKWWQYLTVFSSFINMIVRCSKLLATYGSRLYIDKKWNLKNLSFIFITVLFIYLCIIHAPLFMIPNVMIKGYDPTPDWTIVRS